jgi:predicted CXXCH cytochrome family protein
MNLADRNLAQLRRVAATAVFWIGLLALIAGTLPAQTINSCLDCHQNLPEPLGVTAEKYSQDIHFQKGLTCASCHGGDPTSDDPEKSMSRAAHWKGKIDRRQIPQLCASCHSDAELMKKYNPRLRVDQFQQYKTSVHGKKWAAGDVKVAVCTDCHSVHDLRSPSDPRSTVHPTSVAATCARCHADAAYMKPYGIPTNQYAGYNNSVHHDAMMVRGDLSAPTCTTCHGNHGATPPGVASVANVCSTCHAFQAQLFEKSPHKAAFATAGFPGCVTCHSNHEIKHPTDELIGTRGKAVCIECHTEGDPGFKTAGEMKNRLAELDSAVARSTSILATAERAGMEVSQAKLQADQARDALLKSRVTIHSSDSVELDRDVTPGMKLAKETYVAGQRALAERRFRRIGLGLSLIAIAMVLVGLRLYIRQIEGVSSSAD